MMKKSAGRRKGAADVDLLIGGSDQERPLTKLQKKVALALECAYPSTEGGGFREGPELDAARKAWDHCVSAVGRALDAEEITFLRAAGIEIYS